MLRKKNMLTKKKKNYVDENKKIMWMKKNYVSRKK